MGLTVNNEPISDELLDAEFSQIKVHYERMGNMSCCERNDEFMEYAKENLIAKTLLGQYAREAGEKPTEAQIDQAIAHAKEEHGGEESFYFSLGITPGMEDAIRPQVAESLQLDSTLLAITESAPPATDEELRAFHLKNTIQFTSSEEVRASHIFRTVSRVEEREGILEDLRQLRKRALAGEDFDTLARENSDKEDDEIDLGFFKRGDLMDEFEIMVFSMEVGEISPTLATSWGLHVAKLTDRKPPQPIPFSDCREQVLEQFLLERRNDLLQAKVAELKKSAVIKVED
jgi:parvulin-like peptidyl-prolyl isomerase